MVKLKFELENLTTDQKNISVELPMAEHELKSKLIDGCEYIVVDYEDDFEIEAFDDIISINEKLNLINSENTKLTKSILRNILKASSYHYVDDEDFVHKICNNDFMYEIVRIPHNSKLSSAEYAAYHLCVNHNVPFSLNQKECEDAIKQGIDFDGWSYAWIVYTFMGFGLVHDDIVDSLVTIVNMEDAE